LEFNVPFQHKYGYIRDDLYIGPQITSLSCQVQLVMVFHLSKPSLLWTLITVINPQHY